MKMKEISGEKKHLTSFYTTINCKNESTFKNGSKEKKNTQLVWHLMTRLTKKYCRDWSDKEIHRFIALGLGTRIA